MKIAVISDLHAGHMYGLVDPAHFTEDHHEEGWELYQGMIEPVDFLMLNGDCVDGKGKKSGGTELISTDLFTQAKISKACILAWNAPKIIMAFGTDYHTRDNNVDMEEVLAEMVNADLTGDHVYVSIDGLGFSLRHHVGVSQVSDGYQAALLIREVENNHRDADRGYCPKADVIIRSHRHRYIHCDGKVGTDHRWDAFITPALQTSAKYARKKLSAGGCDFGVLILTVEDGKLVDYEAKTAMPSTLKSTAVEM